MARKLKDDVQALGGDQDDYEMLKNVDSDAEDRPVASSNINERALSQDVSKFMKSLKIPSATNVDKAPDAKNRDKKAKKVVSDGVDALPVKRDTKTGKAKTDALEPQAAKIKSDRKAAKNAGKSTVTTDAAPHPLPEAEKKSKKGKKSSVLARDAEVHSKKPADTQSIQDVKPVASSSKGFIVHPVSNWYDAVPVLPSVQPSAQDTITSLSARAEKLLAQDVSRFDSTQKQSHASDAGFVQRVLSSGTLSDRLSALTLLAQASPLHNQATLENLRGMAKKKSREGSLKAVRAIVDWWVGGGAPDRKLKYFRDQSLAHPDVTDAHLVVWYFEDWLKKYFFSILQILEALSMDPLPYVRLQACTFIFQLLRDRPEQEQNLLRLLVNKLGDSERSVASRVSYHIMQLLQAHPQMKTIVISEVEASSILGSGKKSGGQYYAVITFNQMVLSAKEGTVANRLMDLYFKLFREMLGEKEEQDKQDKADADDEEKPSMKRRKKGAKGKGKDAKDDDDAFATLEEGDSKMISAILTGINRALPFASLQESSFTKHIDTLFRITHEATFNISIQALMLIDHVVSSLAALPSSADLSNRFYRTLYAALLDARLAQSGSKHALFLTLLARAMRRDEEVSRRAAFVRRLVGSLAMHGPGFVCAALVMLGRLSKQQPDVRELVSRRGNEDENEKYDPGKREPLYAHAQGTCLWELVPLLSHYHPSVALHARQLRDNERLTGAPDVGLYSLATFLDRFVLKNAKKPKTGAVRGASAMQPDSHAHEAEVDEDQLRKMDEDEVEPELLFYHRFVKIKGERERKMGRRKKKADGDDAADAASGSEDGAVDDESDKNDNDEEDSELDEDEIWAAMKDNAPLLEDDVDLDDSDVDLPSEDNDSSSDGEDGQDDNDSLDADAVDAPLDGDLSDGAENDSGSDNEMDFLEDDDDVVDDDELIDFPSEDDAEQDDGEAWNGITEPDTGNKRKRAQGKESDAMKRKKRLRELPTFATYEDYQRMIEDEPEDNV